MPKLPYFVPFSEYLSNSEPSTRHKPLKFSQIHIDAFGYALKYVTHYIEKYRNSWKCTQNGSF